MSSTKVLLIVLILTVVFFIVFIVGGSGKPGPSTNPRNDMKDFKSKPHPGLNAFNGLMAPFSLKLKVKDLQPPVTVFDLQAAPHYTVRILPDNDHKFRQAKFAVQPGKGCMRMTFEASGQVPDNMSRTQGVPDPDDDKQSNEFTFTIFPGGGTLTVDRLSPLASPPCRISLQ